MGWPVSSLQPVLPQDIQNWSTVKKTAVLLQSTQKTQCISCVKPIRRKSKRKRCSRWRVSFLVESQCRGYDRCFHKLVSWRWNNWRRSNPDEVSVEWTSISSSPYSSLLHNPAFPPADQKKKKTAFFMFCVCCNCADGSSLPVGGGGRQMSSHSDALGLIMWFCRLSPSKQCHKLFRKIRDSFVINWSAQTPPSSLSCSKCTSSLCQSLQERTGTY